MFEEVQLQSKEVDKIHPQHWCGQHYSDVESPTNYYDYSNCKEKKKSAMSRIAEIARFNKIRHFYDLQDESGPAHKKLFTVKLVLTSTETFEGSGTSIKKAQQASAELALQHTKLSLPNERLVRRKNHDSTRPDRVLQSVCRSLQYQPPHYVVCNPPVFPDPGCPLPEHILIPLSATVMYGPEISSMPIDPQRPLGPKLQVVIVNINGKSIATGIGESYPLAKQDAASKALTVLTPLLEEHQTKHLMNRMNSCQISFHDNNHIPKHKQKSVISDIHEKAHQLKLNVVFEVVKEDGPPHDRQYVVRCAFMTVNNTVKAEAIGQGKKKKAAQQDACTQLLKIVEHMGFENSSMVLANNVYKSQKKLAALNREPKRKTIVKDKKMDPLYGHQINPVSRLIQIFQTKNQEHPLFELIAEHGISKYKEFIIRVTCRDKVCEGKGPNKRLAKRAAAEAMLDCIGYVKPLPTPGKSLLKKCFDNLPEEEINISKHSDVFNSSENENSQDAECDLSSVKEDGKYNKCSYSENEKRKVTFNSQVHACPPPGDNNYPKPTVTLLKKDTIVEGKIRRLKRTKEHRRALTAEQVVDVSLSANEIIKMLTGSDQKKENSSAFYQLDQLSNEFKFSVQYTTFPEAGPSQHFTIVSLGLEEPLVGHGTGGSTLEADENAAFAALVKLKDLASSKTSTIS